MSSYDYLNFDAEHPSKRKNSRKGKGEMNPEGRRSIDGSASPIRHDDLFSPDAN